MFWNLFTTSLELRSGDDQHWREQVAVVRRHQPDVLAVTECWDWQLDDQALFRRAQEEFGYPDGVLYEAKTNCNMAVFCKPEIELLSSKGQPQHEAFWHGYLRTTLRLPDSAEPFTVLLSHLNPFDPTLRRIEASWLRTALRSHQHGVLVMDANTVPPGDPEPGRSLARDQVGEQRCDRIPLAGLAEAGLVDVAAAFDDRRPTFGYHGHTAEVAVSASPVRLDQAWATPSVEVSSYRVIDGDAGSPETNTASDHRPIMINMR